MCESFYNLLNLQTPVLQDRFQFYNKQKNLYHIFITSNILALMIAPKPQKIIMLGESNVGKTAILQRFINDKFSENHTMTLGASFHQYILVDAEGDRLKLDLWDTAGQQKYRSLLSLYYKNSDGVIITFDVTDQKSFEAVKYWTKQIEDNCQFPPCVILVGNKSDKLSSSSISPTISVSDKVVNKFLGDKRDWKYIVTSAKENKNIKKVFDTISSMIKKQQKRRKASKIQQKKQKKKVAIDSSIFKSTNKKSGSDCC